MSGLKASETDCNKEKCISFKKPCVFTKFFHSCLASRVRYLSRVNKTQNFVKCPASKHQKQTTIEDIHIRSSFKIPFVFTIFHNFSGRAKFFIGLKLKFVSNRDTWCFHDFFVLTFDFVFDSTPAQGARNILARNFKMSQLEFYGKRKGFNFERKKKS